MTDSTVETFAENREAIEAHLLALGHRLVEWTRTAQLPEDAASALSDASGGTSRGKSWCRHRSVTCDNGMPGIISVCFTKNDGGTFDEWSANSCDF